MELFFEDVLEKKNNYIGLFYIYNWYYMIMKKNVPVSTIMTSNIIKLNLTGDLTKAESLFRKHNIRHIPVVSGNHIVGMLSYTDLLRIAFADAVDED